MLRVFACVLRARRVHLRVRRVHLLLRDIFYLHEVGLHVYMISSC